MFRFRLRTLLIVLALGPPVLAAAWLFARHLTPFGILLASGFIALLVWVVVGAVLVARDAR